MQVMYTLAIGYQRYLYFPRLKNREVLGQAILQGARTRDFFGTAYGEDNGTFTGFTFSDAHVQFDDTLLLIEPEAARAYDVAHPPALTPGPVPPGPTPPAPGPHSPAPPGPTPTSPPIAFHGSVSISPSTARMRMVQVADEIIAILAADPNADVQVAVEIHAQFSTGISDQTKRAITENAETLRFTHKNWE
jgi:hypothetical protein